MAPRISILVCDCGHLVCSPCRVRRCVHQRAIIIIMPYCAGGAGVCVSRHWRPAPSLCTSLHFLPRSDLFLLRFSLSRVHASLSSVCWSANGRRTPEHGRGRERGKLVLRCIPRHSLYSPYSVIQSLPVCALHHLSSGARDLVLAPDCVLCSITHTQTVQ